MSTDTAQSQKQTHLVVTSPSEIELVQPFIDACRQTFDNMLNCSLEAGVIRPVDKGHKMYTVTGTVGLTGAVAGAVSISTNADVACKMLEKMTGIETDEVDEFVRDVVGEMANMIGGRGKRDVFDDEVRLGLPQVIVGDSYEFFAPRWAKHFGVELETDIGKCALDVGFNNLPDQY